MGTLSPLGVLLPISPLFVVEASSLFDGYFMVLSLFHTLIAYTKPMYFVCVSVFCVRTCKNVYNGKGHRHMRLPPYIRENIFGA